MIGSALRGRVRVPQFLSTILLTLIVALPGDARAQARDGAQPMATLTAVAIDPFGSRVPKARVTLATDQGVSAADTTNAEGVVTFTGLNPGLYQIAVQADGFESFTSKPVYVGRDEHATVEATLQVGPLEQSVVVTAAAKDI